jgi:predicted transposase YdaD
MTTTPHDGLIKNVFTDVENARGELQTMLPPALVKRLDLNTLRVEPGSFVDEVLKERHSDILYSVRFLDVAAPSPAFLRCPGRSLSWRHHDSRTWEIEE